MFDLGTRADGRAYRYDDATDRLEVTDAPTGAQLPGSPFAVNPSVPYDKAGLIAQCQADPMAVAIGQNMAGGFCLGKSTPTGWTSYGTFGLADGEQPPVPAPDYGAVPETIAALRALSDAQDALLRKDAPAARTALANARDACAAGLAKLP